MMSLSDAKINKIDETFKNIQEGLDLEKLINKQKTPQLAVDMLIRMLLNLSHILSEGANKEKITQGMALQAEINKRLIGVILLHSNEHQKWISYIYESLRGKKDYFSYGNFIGKLTGFYIQTKKYEQVYWLNYHLIQTEMAKDNSELYNLGILHLGIYHWYTGNQAQAIQTYVDARKYLLTKITEENWYNCTNNLIKLQAYILQINSDPNPERITLIEDHLAGSPLFYLDIYFDLLVINKVREAQIFYQRAMFLQNALFSNLPHLSASYQLNQLAKIKTAVRYLLIIQNIIRLSKNDHNEILLQALFYNFYRFISLLERSHLSTKDENVTNLFILFANYVAAMDIDKLTAQCFTKFQKNNISITAHVTAYSEGCIAATKIKAAKSKQSAIEKFKNITQNYLHPPHTKDEQMTLIKNIDNIKQRIQLPEEKFTTLRQFTTWMRTHHRLELDAFKACLIKGYYLFKGPSANKLVIACYTQVKNRFFMDESVILTLMKNTIVGNQFFKQHKKFSCDKTPIPQEILESFLQKRQ